MAPGAPLSVPNYRKLGEILVEAGVPDDAVTVTYDGLRGHMSYRSLHALAGFTYSEGNSPLSRTRWQKFAHAGDQGMGSSQSPVHREPPEENAPVEAPPAAARLSVTRACEVCGGPVTAKRTDAMLCGPACKQRAYRERKVA